MLQYKLTPMTVKFSITCTEIKTASTCRILVFIYKYANQINVNILKSAINFHFTTPIVRRRERGMHLTKLDPPRSPVLVSQYFSQHFHKYFCRHKSLHTCIYILSLLLKLSCYLNTSLNSQLFESQEICPQICPKYWCVDSQVSKFKHCRRRPP